MILNDLNYLNTMMYCISYLIISLSQQFTKKYKEKYYKKIEYFNLKGFLVI